MSIEKLRDSIDEIDVKLVELFRERMEISLEIAKEKRKQSLPTLNAAREKEILLEVSQRLGEPLDGYGRILYNTIFDLSKSYQNNYLREGSQLADKIKLALEETPKLFPEKATVACQGIRGSYSQIAADKLFTVPSIMYFNTFDSVFSAVEKGLCRYGILPLENSSYGSVGAVYDLMRKRQFYIVRSIRLRVSHYLLGLPGSKLSDIKEIVSHEQALGQCEAFLKSMKDVKVTVFDNTAEAAKYVAQSGRKDLAAIASKSSGDNFNLDILQKEVQDSDNNYTRFICISKKLEIYPGAHKIGLILSLPHEPSSLYHMIAKFSCQGLNLTKLESRPIPGSDFEFMFYFELEASVYSPALINLLSELEGRPDVFVFLGNYSEVL
ncbi:MAG: bifunctional chorismate mutase/prephenate dehydratase [Anaerovoracaceae bacterium]